ncbi:MAG: chromate transporter [Clostridia bacterium]|nr:chromate transporter [Clostridia bacterium]
MKTTLTLFLTMMKIGLFTFGGGYAMLALLENEFVSKRGWMEKEEFLDMVAIAESTPGPIAINSATYIGYKMAGVLGSASATIAVCIPSFVIIYLISLFFDAFLSLTLVANAFRGIQACVVYLIFSAGYKMLKGIEKTPLSIVIFIVVMICLIAFSVFAVSFSTVFYVLICGAVGVFAYLLSRLVKRKEAGK